MKIPFTLVFTATLVLAGCSSRPPEDYFVGMRPSVFAPLPPPFVKGPIALMLTNQSGFSARATMPAAAPDWPKPLSGQLLGRGSKLLFAADPEKSNKKHPDAGLIFIWDVDRNTGFVLSDALQGYAPISSTLSYTNIAYSPASAAPRKIQGHSCKLQEAKMISSDGSSAAFRIWIAADLNGLPVKVESIDSAAPLMVDISEIRLEPPPLDLFAPPAGFTRYNSPEAMMTEITIREQHLKGHPIGGWGERGPADDLENRPRSGR